MAQKTVLKPFLAQSQTGQSLFELFAVSTDSMFSGGLRRWTSGKRRISPRVDFDPLGLFRFCFFNWPFQLFFGKGRLQIVGTVVTPAPLSARTMRYPLPAVAKMDALDSI
jgi:hypothetical protein